MSDSPDTGDAAPDFTLPRDGGGEVSLSDYRGKMLVLYFYPKDDTSGCTREGVEFSQAEAAFAAAGAAILGLSKDTPAKHDKFKAKHELTIALASDEDGAVCEKYGVWKAKKLYGREYMGIERTTFLIDAEGRISRIWRKVRVPGHVEDVQKTVQNS